MKYIENEQDFTNEVLGFDGTVLVDFYADWCGPCKVVGPIIEELANQYANRPNIKIVKVNVDNNQEVASQYNIMSIPTVIIFKNGQVEFQQVGAMPKAFYEDKIQGIN